MYFFTTDQPPSDMSVTTIFSMVQLVRRVPFRELDGVLDECLDQLGAMSPPEANALIAVRSSMAVLQGDGGEQILFLNYSGTPACLASAST